MTKKVGSMQEKIARIHQTSMAILENVGIKLHHPEICSALQEKGIKVKNGVAYFSEDQVMSWVGKAPGRFIVYARNPDHDALIGSGQAQYLGGYGCSAIIESTGNRRDATLDDYIRFIKLVQQCSGFRFNGGILVQPTELPPAQMHAAMAYTTMLFSDKCIMGQPGPAEWVGKIMTLASMTFGGREALLQKPRVITLVNTLSPLQIDRIALETIKIYAEYGQPLVISAGPMSGTTAPITPAGALCLGNAEVLAAIAIAQMLREGTPVVMGISVVPADMRNGGLNVGAPANATCIRYAKALANKYGVPCRCGGSGSDAEGPTAQSGYESMLNMFVTLQEKVDLIIHSAGILSSYSAMSFEKFIIDLEVIRLIEQHLADIAVDDNALALSVITETGHGGEFLTHSHTLEQCRSVPWTSLMAATGDLEIGENSQESYLAKVNKTLERILYDYRRPILEPELRTALENFLIETGMDATQLKVLKEAAARP
jgi:trimethylamine--corrinoid protein Co-methyltransferase